MACDAERTALANAAADLALSMATEAIAYADYTTSMMATYAAMANWSLAICARRSYKLPSGNEPAVTNFWVLSNWACVAST